MNVLGQSLVPKNKQRQVNSIDPSASVGLFQRSIEVLTSRFSLVRRVAKVAACGATSGGN